MVSSHSSTSPFGYSYPKPKIGLWIPTLIVKYLRFHFCVLSLPYFLFLFTSVKFSLTLSLEPFQFSAGDFSTPLTLPLVASLFFPPDLFWFVFPMHLILSPWYGILSDLLKRIIFWFCDFLQAIPAFIIITCIHQHPQVELEAVVIEENNEGNI
jgi:hypothetical protein